MSFTDFLGNTIEVGDKVIYSPRGNDAGSLIFAEVLELTDFMKTLQRYNKETKSYEYFEVPRVKPKLQPINGSGFFGRDYDLKWNKETEEYDRIPITPKPVFLQDCANIVLIEKGKKNESVD